MKKSTLSLVALGLILTGCAAPAMKVGTYQMTAEQEQGKQMRQDANLAHKKGSSVNATKPAVEVVSQEFRCNHNATITAHYFPDQGMASLTVTVPSLKIKNQKIALNEAVSGSGMYFVNDKTPNTKYEWHAKGDDAIFDVTIGNKTHSLQCQTK